MKIILRLLVLCAAMSGPVFAEKHVQTLLEYGAQCAREIGEIPPFDCNSGMEIPITVDGKPQGANESPSRCDKPSLLHIPDGDWPGQCLPGSKVLNLSRGSTQISVYCRHDKSHKDPKPGYDEVDIVLHHSGNGKTCWFQSRPPSGPNAANGIDTSRVPPPNEKMPPHGVQSAVGFWKAPVETAKQKCMSCHDAGPYIFSPYIGQVWDKIPTDQWGKYSSIGQAFSHEPLLVISTPGNACIGCHRIGSDRSCDLYIPLSIGRRRSPGNNQLADAYPLSHWMPPDNNTSESEWNAANIKSVEAILSCCRNKGRADRDCSFTPIPTSDARKNN